MKNRIFLFTLIFTSALLSCGGGKNNKPALSGTIKGGEGKNLVFEKIENNAPNPVDTVKLTKEGTFEFKLPKGKLDFYRLNMDGKFIVLCLDSTHNAVITANAATMEDYTVKGSVHSEVIHDFFAKVNVLAKERAEAETQLRGINASDTAKIRTLQLKLQESLEKMNTTAHEFIDKNPKSPAVIVMQNFLNPMTDMDYFKKIEKALAASMPNSVYHTGTTNFIKQLEAQKEQMELQKKAEESIKIGEPVSDIALPNPDGQTMSLSSLKGKVVLVDFWASWCGPCRKENPNVIALYDKYHGKGFEVFSVSLDKNKEAWIKAIQDDNLKWKYHVSDLAQWNSIVVKQFAINSIPFTLLIDRNGNIAGKGLRGPALEEKLAELMGK